MCRRIVPIVMSVAIELDQPLVTDPEVMRDLVEHDVSDLAAQTIGVAGSGSRVIGPRKMLILSGSTPLYVLLLRRQRYTAVQAEQRPPVGRLVLDDDLNVARSPHGDRPARSSARRQSPLRTDP